MFDKGLTYQKTITMVTVACCNCGIVFGMPSDFNDRCKDDENRYFYCPSGHSQHYSKSTSMKLKEELDKVREQKEHQQRQRQLAEESQRRVEIELKKNKTKLRNIKTRVANGICPCCNRTFINLQRHMHTKHPEFIPPEQQDNAPI